MYCKQIIDSRISLSVYPLVDAPEINYYNPEENCLASVGGKGLCGICGEKSKWKKNNILRLHTTKCCPYRYHSGIEDRKGFVDAMAEMIHWQQEEQEKEVSQYQDYIEDKDSECKTLNEDNEILNKKIDETTDTLKFMKEMFSPKQIEERKEEIKGHKEFIAETTNQIAKKEMALREKQDIQDRQLLLLDIQRQQHKNYKEVVDENVKLNGDILKTAYLKTQLQEQQLNNEKLIDMLKSKKGSIPKYVGEMCCICQDNISITDKAITTKCDHHFHIGCYTNFICHNSKNLSYGDIKCPLCRKVIHTIEYE
tara:strand:+ start:21151 stop:22080 length:930 start_codon:yes stop_codon:yes gene_type:complete